MAHPDPVNALRAVLALRPGSERVRSKTRRAAAARALGLLSGEGWRAHHEKPLLLDLAHAICTLEAAVPDQPPQPPVSSVSRLYEPSGIDRYYSDFVDIEAGWEQLFANAHTLDLAVMYGATWRNTYRKHLTALANRPDGRLRVVLPSPAADSPAIAFYAHTLRLAPGDFRQRVTEAINDFRTIAPRRHTEIYLTTAAFRHAVYLFTHQAVLALYALCGERIPTPALLTSEGGLLSFLRLDFDRLLDHSERIA